MKNAGMLVLADESDDHLTFSITGFTTCTDNNS